MGAVVKFGGNYDLGVVRPSAITGNNSPKVTEITQREVTDALHRMKSVEEALNDAQAQIEAAPAALTPPDSAVRPRRCPPPGTLSNRQASNGEQSLPA